MDRIAALEAFVVAAETKSINQASKLLGASQSAISQTLRKLEAQLGYALLVRSPYGVRLTGPGEKTFKNAKEVLKNYQSLVDDLAENQDEISGDLKIGISVCLQSVIQQEHWLALKQKGANINLSLQVISQVVDMTRDPLDLAVVIGEHAVSGGILRKLSEVENGLYVHPDLLAKAASKFEVADLQNMNMVSCPYDAEQGSLTLRKGGTVVSQETKTSMVVNTPDILIEAVVGKMGFAKLPMDLAAPFVAKGDLIQLLPNYRLEPVNIYLAYPERRVMTHAMELVAEHIKSALNVQKAA